jgi:hypothetical protein
MPDYSKSFEYIIRDVFTLGANAPADEYSTEDVIRDVFNPVTNTLNVSLGGSNSYLRVL